MSEKIGWLARLKAGLGKSSHKLSDGIVSIFTKRKLDRAMLDELEELLIAADMGAALAAQIVAKFSEGRFDKEISPEEVKETLAAQIEAILAPAAKSLNVSSEKKPEVILVVGVNGNGKTTTIGKLARQCKDKGIVTMLAAADTFRAAAVEQLKVWGERTNCPVITAPANSDPASVAYAALEQAKTQGADLLLIDSAGRLQNKANLMAELQKIVKVLKKLDDSAPHQVLLVLDATTGQNALQQAQAFKEVVGVTGLIVTKLDGSAKAGVIVALAQKFGLPIHAVGVGEGVEDLRDFSATDFARSLLGLS